VSARWLLKGVGVVIGIALFCSYGSLMLLYWLSQWQIVLHPDKAAQRQAAPPGLIRFGPDESGQPQLTGEWLAAPQGGRYANRTILFLAGGDGSRGDFRKTVESLQGLGINVFNFDYRGYGLSGSVHPSQQRMLEDSELAWSYLVGTRGIAAGSIVPYGTGVGASLAVHLAETHKEIPAVILDSPRADLLDFARADPRSHLLPVDWLFHERFPLARPLSIMTTPKLLLQRREDDTPAFATAAAPKITVKLSSDTDGALSGQSVTRFLDQYLPADR
jgi:pimeloyl-ACP methyl ester carboxylesterase